MKKPSKGAGLDVSELGDRANVLIKNVSVTMAPADAVALRDLAMACRANAEAIHEIAKSLTPSSGIVVSGIGDAKEKP